MTDSIRVYTIPLTGRTMPACNSYPHYPLEGVRDPGLPSSLQDSLVVGVCCWRGTSVGSREMSLATGARLGPYEILAPIGAGGMGEVYKARDTRLERTVAIKVLPVHLSASPESRQRFEREAKTISQLSHPHICALHDVGREADTEYIVMEYLEGETLSERLAKAPLLLEHTLRFGQQIADALQKAHRQGIVHRDLKPANVMITKTGVKLLDFGLAKAMAPAGSPSSLTALPTQEGLTREGTILGTFQYMAPEQLEGNEADARTDIWALGCVLYEAVTGKKTFSGASQASLITAIMSSDPPPISSVQPMSPPALDRVVKTCLAKDPEERWQSAADVRRQLQWIAEGSAAGGAGPTVVASKTRARERLAWILASMFAIAASAVGYLHLRQSPLLVRPFQTSILPPEKTEFEFQGSPPAISPDGRRIAFAAGPPNTRGRLWVRSFEASDAQPLPGTEGAAAPFWSPDSRFLGFFADGKLKKIDVTGGMPQALTDAPDGDGGTWSQEGVILFTTDGPLHRVPESGGASSPVTRVVEDEAGLGHSWPMFLPDGRHFLYLRYLGRTGDGSNPYGLVVGTLGFEVRKGAATRPSQRRLRSRPGRGARRTSPLSSGPRPRRAALRSPPSRVHRGGFSDCRAGPALRRRKHRGLLRLGQRLAGLPARRGGRRVGARLVRPERQASSSLWASPQTTVIRGSPTTAGASSSSSATGNRRIRTSGCTTWLATRVPVSRSVPPSISFLSGHRTTDGLSSPPTDVSSTTSTRGRPPERAETSFCSTRRRAFDGRPYCSPEGVHRVPISGDEDEVRR